MVLNGKEIVTMDYFNQKDFLEWLSCNTRFEERGSFDWHYELLSNIIEYGLEHHNHSKDQLAYFISDMIPNVEFDDVARFCDNSILTNNYKC